MKRILALLISLMMVFALVACNNTEDPGGSGGGTGGGSGGGGGGGTPQAETHIYDGSPHAESWRDGASYDYIDGVWDSSVLPDIFPTQPTTGTIDDITTYYIAKDDPKHTTYAIAEVSFPDENYYYYEVGFLGNEAHQTYLVDALTQKGFFIDYDDSWGNNRLFINAFSSDYYVNIRRFDSDENPECPYEFDCYIVPKQMSFPVSSFNGVPLPDFGYITSEYDLMYMKYETDYSDFEDVKFDVATTNPWYFSFDLEGVTAANHTAYINRLVSDGWVLQSNGYYTKGTMTVDVDYNAEDGSLEVEAASDEMIAPMIDGG